MSTTIFEKIVAGEIPCHKVYEDSDVLGFLDINPKSLGHSLIIPKKHFPDIYEIPVDLLSKLMSATQKVAKVVKQTVGASGIKIVINNGADAGQIIFHSHIHVIPYPKQKENGVIQQKFKYEDGQAESLSKMIFDITTNR